jgi:hypothetical protein
MVRRGTTGMPPRSDMRRAASMTLGKPRRERAPMPVSGGASAASARPGAQETLF